METTGESVYGYQPLNDSAQKIAAYISSVTNAELNLFKLPLDFLGVSVKFVPVKKVIVETVYSEVYQTMIASERVLARDWDQPDEDEAWRGL
jgi:hypothetical protein